VSSELGPYCVPWYLEPRRNRPSGISYVRRGGFCVKWNGMLVGQRRGCRQDMLEAAGFCLTSTARAVGLSDRLVFRGIRFAKAFRPDGAIQLMAFPKFGTNPFPRPGTFDNFPFRSFSTPSESPLALASQTGSSVCAEPNEQALNKRRSPKTLESPW